MKHIIRTCFVLLTAGILLLSGCAGEGTPVNTEVLEDAPELTYGVLETGKLEVLYWNSNRCEITSGNTWAETEMGYYHGENGYLFYADKVDLNNWVPVCGNPSCNHISQTHCAARMIIANFVIRDGIIYHQDFPGRHPNPLKRDADGGLVLVSMTIDGKDKKYAYGLADAVSSGGGSASTRLSDQRWMYYAEDLNPDGTYTVKLFCADASGTRLLFEKQYDQDTLDEINANKFQFIAGKLYGQTYYRYPALVPDHYFRFEGEKFLYLDASLVSAYGGYISGTTLRTFRPNDGYYDINTETKEEVKLADSRLTDSEVIILLPNCIIESTLFNEKFQGEQAMTIFDGTAWRDVILPNELKQVTGATSFRVETVTSDRIVFSVNVVDFGENTDGKNGRALYAITISDDRWEIKYMTTLAYMY